MRLKIFKNLLLTNLFCLLKAKKFNPDKCKKLSHILDVNLSSLRSELVEKLNRKMRNGWMTKALRGLHYRRCRCGFIFGTQHLHPTEPEDSELRV